MENGACSPRGDSCLPVSEYRMLTPILTQDGAGQCRDKLESLNYIFPINSSKKCLLSNYLLVIIPGNKNIAAKAKGSAFNPSTLEAEAGIVTSSRPTWSI